MPRAEGVALAIDALAGALALSTHPPHPSDRSRAVGLVTAPLRHLARYGCACCLAAVGAAWAGLIVLRRELAGAGE